MRSNLWAAVARVSADSRQPRGMASRPLATLARVTAWIARGAWLLVALIGGETIEAAVDGRSTNISWIAAIGGWAVWAVVAVALTIPSVPALTAARVGTPLALVATLVAGIAGTPSADLVFLSIPAFVALVAVFTADFGRQFVQASAYGDEERFPLHAPAAAGTAAVLAWLVWVTLLFSGPLLLGSRSWVIGAIASLLALAGTIFFAPRWNQLSRRWFVLVPAGIVLHDPVVMADTVALRTADVAGLRLAPADTEAADLTGPASGYAIEITTTKSVTAVFAFTPSEPDGRAIHLTAMLVAPSRPGQVLAAAGARGLPVG